MDAVVGGVPTDADYRAHVCERLCVALLDRLRHFLSLRPSIMIFSCGERHWTHECQRGCWCDRSGDQRHPNCPPCMRSAKLALCGPCCLTSLSAVVVVVVFCYRSCAAILPSWWFPACPLAPARSHPCATWANLTVCPSTKSVAIRPFRGLYLLCSLHAGSGWYSDSLCLYCRLAHLRTDSRAAPARPPAPSRISPARLYARAKKFPAACGPGIIIFPPPI